MTKISTASEVIARRDALSPSAEGALKIIQSKLIDSEWVRAFSPNYQTFFPRNFSFTKIDIVYVENAMKEAGYVDVSLKKCGDDSGFVLSFSLPNE